MFAELETFIQKRETTKSLRMIKGLLTTQLDVDQLLYLASAYRRLGYPSRAVKILAMAMQKRALFGPAEKQKLRVAHLEVVNLLGASHYASRLAAQLSTALLPARQRYQMANIHLANYAHEAALELLNGLTATDFSDYEWQFLCVAKADCWAGLGQWKEAEKIIDPLTQSPHELIASIAKTAQGEYLVRQGKYQPALDVFLTIKFSAADVSVDRAIYYKWRALAEFYCGQDQAAKAHLKIAETFFDDSNQKPEALLDLYYWRGRFQQSQTKRFPAVWKLALAYPAEFFFYRSHIAQESGEQYLSILDGKIMLGKSRKLPSAAVYVDESSDYCVVGERRWLGIPKKYSLLAKLVRAGSLGVQLWRLMDTLWPGDLSQHDLLEKRLADLIEHLRGEGFEIEWRGQRLYCENLVGIGVCVGLGDSYIGQSFLLSHGEFSRQELENFYGVSRSRAGEIIALWREQGRIVHGTKLGSYRVV